MARTPGPPFGNYAKKASRLCLASFCLSLLAATQPVAQIPPVHALTLHDHQFEPAVLEVPTLRNFTLEVINEDSSPEEIEIPSLGIKELLGGQARISIEMPKLNSGTYDVSGWLHSRTAHGTIHVQ